MACAGCGHEDHAPNPCAACSAANTTCWQGIKITGGDGDRSASGQIELAHGLEERPCLSCRSFEKDTPRLIRHLLRHKLTPDENGIFTTPIAKDFPGRVSMRIDPRSSGFCRRDAIVVDMLATCPEYKSVRTVSEFESRIRE